MKEKTRLIVEGEEAVNWWKEARREANQEFELEPAPVVRSKLAIDRQQSSKVAREGSTEALGEAE